MGRYPANKLMVRGPFVEGELKAPFGAGRMPFRAAFGISPSFPGFSPPPGQVAHVFLALPPLSRGDIAASPIPFDLHA